MTTKCPVCYAVFSGGDVLSQRYQVIRHVFDEHVKETLPRGFRRCWCDRNVPFEFDGWISHVWRSCSRTGTDADLAYSAPPAPERYSQELIDMIARHYVGSMMGEEQPDFMMRMY